MDVKSVHPMGLTRQSAAVSVLLAMEEHRQQAGLRLKLLREGKGWSQPELAYRSGVSAKTISRFENGRHDGRRNTIRLIAKALGVTEADIVGEAPSPLGLGAREAQVETGFEEFRRYVAQMNAKLDAIMDHLGIDPLRELVPLADQEEQAGATDAASASTAPDARRTG